MIKCNFCDKEFEGGRAAHCHMNQKHHDEYAAVDFNLEEVTTGYMRKKPKVFKTKVTGEKKEEPEEMEKPNITEVSDRPKKLRLLNKMVAAELDVYRAGYRYYDPESELAFTTEECQSEGWI